MATWDPSKCKMLKDAGVIFRAERVPQGGFRIYSLQQGEDEWFEVIAEEVVAENWDDVSEGLSRCVKRTCHARSYGAGSAGDKVGDQPLSKKEVFGLEVGTWVLVRAR